jgi:hypothetical protein
MDEVDHDGDVHLSLPGFSLDALDLVAVAVHQGHPAALVVRVTALGLVEDPADYPGGVVGHTGRHPLGLGPGRWRWVLTAFGGQHVGGAAGNRGEVVDRAHLGHAFSVALFAFRQAGLELVGGRSRFSVAGRNESGRITMPLPSTETTSTSPLAPGSGAEAAAS